MVKLAIAEDNEISLQIVKDKLSHFADIRIDLIAQNGEQLLQLLEQNRDIDIILMDIEMPIMNGIEATAKVKDAHPNIKIVIHTIFDTDDHVFEAIKSGADSYILKDSKAEKVHESLISTYNGGAVMSPSIAAKALQILKGYIPKNTEEEKIKLSERETEILENISKGLANKQIADVLNISPFTVKRHIENIYQKLHIHNRIELIEKARKSGLI